MAARGGPCQSGEKVIARAMSEISLQTELITMQQEQFRFLTQLMKEYVAASRQSSDD